MKKCVVLFLFIILPLAYTSVFGRDADEGLPGYFLNLGLGARALSLGRAYTAMAEGSSAVYWNPAGLPSAQRDEIALSHATLFEDTRYNSISFSRRLSKRVSFGLGVIQLYSGGIMSRDSANNPLEEIADRSNAYLVSFGCLLHKKLSLGIGGKVVSKSFDSITTSWNAIDVSALYVPIQKARFGLTIQNALVTGAERSKDRAYEIPLNLRFGVACQPLPHNVTVSMDVNKTDTQALKLYAGVEWRLLLMALRAGYDNGDLTSGIGFTVNNFIFDYAVLNHYMGLSHRATVSFTFAKGGSADVQKKEKKKASLDKYDIIVNTMNEIPLAIYHLFQKKGISVINVRLLNKQEQIQRFKITYRLGLQNQKESAEVVVPGKEEKSVNLVPTISREDIKKIEVVPTPASLFVEVYAVNQSGKEKMVYQNKFEVIFLPFDQFVPQKTDADGYEHDLLDTMIGWITYNDRGLSGIITEASEKGLQMMPPVKLIGFQEPSVFTRKELDTRTLQEKTSDYLSQVRLIYETLKVDHKLTYINQPVVYNESQRIKLPMDTVKNKGNCVELSVLLASLLESIEIDPILAVFPKDKHVAIGWKVYGDNREAYTLLETNVFGEDFDRVIDKGNGLIREHGLEKGFSEGLFFNEKGIYKKGDDVLIFDVKKIRANIPPSPYIQR